MQVTVYRSSEKTALTEQELDSADLKLAQPTDLGDVLLRFTGVSLKNYGGVGGLKTFHFRGLGSGHSLLVSNGFERHNSYIGSVNLAQYNTNNLTSVKLGTPNISALLPPNAYASAAVLSIESGAGTHPREGHAGGLESAYGSFGYFSLAPYWHWKKDRSALSIQTWSRRFEGRYPYIYEQNGFQLRGTRERNQLIENQIAVQYQYKTKDSSALRILLEGYQSAQELPGAVVFYNPGPRQYLSQLRLNFMADYRSSRQDKKHRLHQSRVYVTVDGDGLHYVDSAFLNDLGFLDSRYNLYRTSLGMLKSLSFHNTQFLLGADVVGEWLLEGGKPAKASRYQTHWMSALRKTWQRHSIQLNINGNFGVNLWDTSTFVMPAAGILWEHRLKWGNNWKVTADVRYSNRLPTFSELFYNPVGATNLQPETAWQNRMGIMKNLVNRFGSVSVTGQAFYNKVWNKIQVLPTQNLFVWSVQNLGIVEIYGSELVVDQLWKWKSSRDWQLNIVTNYTYQLALDRTDKNAFNYGHQIAYIPFHTLQQSLKIHYSFCYLGADVFLSDFRYSLNENLQANVLPAFGFLDLVGGIQWSKADRKHKEITHQWQLQLNIKNITNEHYFFVRSYPMPGVNALITLRYAF